MDYSNLAEIQGAQQQPTADGKMIDIVQNRQISLMRARLEQDFNVSSLKIDSSNLLIPTAYQKDVDLSPMTNYILTLQKELLRTPTPVSILGILQPHHHQSVLFDPETSDYMHNQMSISNSTSSLAVQNLSLDDGGTNWATLFDCIQHVEKPESRLEVSEAVLKEACSMMDIEDNSDSGLKDPDPLSRQPSLSTLSPPCCDIDDYCQNSEVHELVKRQTTEANLDGDLQNLQHVEKAHQKIKRTGNGKPRKNENRPPRYAIKTKSEMEVIDDGYRWRKYGRKTVKQNPHRRNYYKCSYPTCKVKKRVERSPEDSLIIITTYEGTHNHQNPSMDSRNATQFDHEGSLLSRSVASGSRTLSSRDSYDLFVQMGES